MEFREPVLRRDILDGLLEVITEINRTISNNGTEHLSSRAAIDLKHEMNKITTDYTCTNAFISNNEKEFFGIYIVREFGIANLFGPSMKDIDEKCHYNYSIDIDSKLFTIGLSPTQILTLIIYDTYVILDHEATIDVVSTFDAIIAGRNENLFLDNDNTIKSKFPTLFRFCVSDYLYRKYSICCKTENGLIRSRQLLDAYSLSSDFDYAVDIVIKHSNAVSRAVPNPALSLNWFVSMLRRYTPGSTEILNVVNDFISITGSNLVRNILAAISRSLVVRNPMNNKVIEEASLFAGIRKSGMRSLENDLFEYDMRVKNIDDEDSAIFLMRQINSRMSIIQDYLEEEKLSESEIRRWQNLYDRYNQLRIKMTSKPIYSKNMYGLFTDYNALMRQSPENTMTMRTIY